MVLNQRTSKLLSLSVGFRYTVGIRRIACGIDTSKVSFALEIFEVVFAFKFFSMQIFDTKLL